MSIVTVLDSRQDWIAVFVDDDLKWQGHPGDFEWDMFFSREFKIPIRWEKVQLHDRRFYGTTLSGILKSE